MCDDVLNKNVLNLGVEISLRTHCDDYVAYFIHICLKADLDLIPDFNPFEVLD